MEIIEYCMGPNFCSLKFSYKTLYLKKLNFRDKIFVNQYFNFAKIQIYTSYYVSNIRQQNGFVFHMHDAKLSSNSQNVQSIQLDNQLAGRSNLHSYSYRCTEDIARVATEQLTTHIVMVWVLAVNQKQTLLHSKFCTGTLTSLLAA